MLIDWFTVGAQALNFLILVWLMKRFLYKPILRAIDAREKTIAAALADATAKQASATKERDDFRQKNETFDKQHSALLTKATDDASAARQKLLDDARKAADTLSERRHDAMRSEATTLREAISQRTQKEVFAIARKALTDLATVTLEERLGEVFTRQLRTMDEGPKARLGAALKTAAGPVIVRSTFELPAEQRAAIENAINETFSVDIHPRYETSPELVSGIELTTNGQKIAWSISDYLTSVEKGVEEILGNRTKAATAPPRPSPKPKPKPKPSGA
jgi:F-type H+-transporting ATPase subunit b